jgi:hypothetical protein
MLRRRPSCLSPRESPKVDDGIDVRIEMSAAGAVSLLARFARPKAITSHQALILATAIRAFGCLREVIGARPKGTPKGTPRGTP